MDVTSAFEWGLTLCAALAVDFLKRSFGSGVGMVLTPLLTLVHSPQFALGLLALYMTWADLGMIRDLWKGWNRRFALILFPGITAGMLLGTWILANLSETQLRKFIGGICFVFALYQTIIEIKGRPPAVPRLPLWLGISVGGEITKPTRTFCFKSLWQELHRGCAAEGTMNRFARLPPVRCPLWHWTQANSSSAWSRTAWKSSVSSSMIRSMGWHLRQSLSAMG